MSPSLFRGASAGKTTEPDAARGLRGARLGAALAAFAAVLLAVAVFSVPAQADTAPTDPTTPSTVSADPLPTVQINGVVWAQQVIGNTVYVGGDFTSARPAGSPLGTNETPRADLLAYDLTTGNLIGSWNPGTNGRVLGLSASPDGSRLYVVGAFTQIAGQTRYRIAAFDTASGNLVNSFAPGSNSTIYDVKATNSTVWFVGEFSNVNNTARMRVASVSAAGGTLLPFQADMEGGYGARAIVLSPDGSKVVVAGSFLTTNGSSTPGRGMAALDSSTGALLPWGVNSVIRNAGNNSAMYSLASDGDSVYGTGYDFGGTKDQDDFEGSFRANWSDGSMVWMEDCHGDSYSVAPMGDTVYTSSHTHYCGNIGGFPQTTPWTFRHSLAWSKAPSTRTITPDIYGYRSFTGQVAANQLFWYPIWGVGSFTGESQATWDVTTSSKYVLYGGEFVSINGVKQQGLVRFATKDIAPNKVGPSVQGGAWVPTASSFRANSVRFSWPANYDPDNQNLTYDVQRRDLGTSTSIYTTKADSSFWNRPVMGYTDSTVKAGQSYDYRVKATDAYGNSTMTNWTTVLVAADGTASAYDTTVLNDNPINYWPLGESGGTAGYDWVTGNDQVTTATGVTRGVSGPIVGTPSTATQFSGSGSGASSTSAVVGPQTFSIEAWFKTTSTSGGKIVGFGDKASGDSGSYDRHIYMDGAGDVTFGVYNNQTSTITSAPGFNDGLWHQVVASLDSTGESLYIDGVRIGSRSDATSAQAYSGYWRIGGDNLGSWPNTGQENFGGSIANVSIYSAALTRAQITAHYTASGRTLAGSVAPTDAYGQAVYNLDPTIYWRLGDSSANAADAGRDNHEGSYVGPVTQGVSGAIAGTTDTAASFTQTGNPAYVVSKDSFSNPTTYSIEGWFNTTTTDGGKLIGFGDANVGQSSSYDRHIYMATDGTVRFGTYNGGVNIVSSSAGLNDGNWHYVVAQQSSSGMQLFIDGSLVDSNSVTTAQNYTGYWRLGGDSGWEGATWWTGKLDDVAIYSAPLTSAQVQQHFVLGSSGAINQPPTASFTAQTSNLGVTVDGTASSDPDGTIASYAWDFGDGQSASGPNATHAYLVGGTYALALTVTDNRGATTTQTQTVTVTAANVPPVASFTNTTNALQVQVDGTASTDPDGTVASYSWDFGDGTFATGATAAHTYARAGIFQVVLTVTDNRGGTDSKTVAVAAVAANVPPVAAFTPTANGLALAVDGSASTDSDGAVASYAWDFGDGGTATGLTASHTYASAGTFNVVLTVTDDKGATNSVTMSVIVSPPVQPGVIASDAFERTATSSWGIADVGGPWTVTGGSAAFSVSGGKGLVALAPSQTREAKLIGISQTSSLARVSFSSDKPSAGGTTSITINGRRVGDDVYSARVRLEPAGVVRLYLLKDEVALGNSYVPNVTYTPGQQINVSLSVTGTNPTAIAGKIWFGTGPEPAAYQLQATDSTAVLQAAGSVGIKAASSSVSTVPVTTLSFDNLSVTGAGTTPSPPPANIPPVAAFTPTVSGLTTAVNGSASTDSDGSVAAYAWTFGDGDTATGASASHTYTAAGTYNITLTVTDDKGATNAVIKPVSVSVPVPPGVLASDTFERAVTASWGAADAGGAWTLTGGNPAFSVANGKGIIVLTPSQTREAKLLAVNQTSSVTHVTFSADQASAGGTTSITINGRRVGNDVYSARVRLEPGGVIRLYILRDEVALGNSYVIPNASYTPGQLVNVALSVTGTSPTAIAGRVWLGTDPEPTTWQLQATDSTAIMQVPGSVGIKAADSSVSTVPVTTLRFDNLNITDD